MDNEITAPPLMDLSLTPEQATAKLAELAAARTPAPPSLDVAPATAVDARRRLDVLGNDPAWRDKFLAGHPAALREFTALHERINAGDPVADALAGAVQPPGEVEVTGEDQISRRNLAQTVQEYRELGISDEASVDIIQGRPQTPEAIAATKIMLNQRKGDPAWVQRYLAGGATEKREMTLMCGIIAGEPV
jgi:hypothetical protein